MELGNLLVFATTCGICVIVVGYCRRIWRKRAAATAQEASTVKGQYGRERVHPPTPSTKRPIDDPTYPTVPPQYRRERAGLEKTTVRGQASQDFASGSAGGSGVSDGKLAWSKGAQAAFQAIDRGDLALFVVGRAGTGKTTLIRGLAERGARQVTLAPTGIAALNAGGQTIHSFFRLPPRILNLDEIKPIRQRQSLMRRLERVVIDEVSMVRADLLDAVDRSLQVNRGSTSPFGGVQVLFVGDFFQLPPVIASREWEPLAKLGYRMPYALGAKVLDRVPTTWIELSDVYRQSDPRFIELLGRIRVGEDLETALTALNNACFRAHRANRTPVTLTPTNRRASDYNEELLGSLPGSVQTLAGKLEGKFRLSGERFPAPQELRLKPGARVMAAANDPQRRWVNGSLGTVVAIGNSEVTVRFDSHVRDESVSRHTWEDIEYGWDDAAGRVVAQLVGTYTQVPLIPAWAITIHKAQGLTLDDVRIDFDSGSFASGQAYVALSRVRTLEGLSFARPIRSADVSFDKNVANFLSAWPISVGARRL